MKDRMIIRRGHEEIVILISPTLVLPKEKEKPIEKTPPSIVEISAN